MALLEEIIDGASGDQLPVATLLRKVKVVASRIGMKTLDQWVEHELFGYDDMDSLPSYRGSFDAEVVGHFAGPFGHGLKNAPIPRMAFPEEYREGGLFTNAFLQPISELEELSRADKVLESYWSADSVAVANYLMQRGEVKIYQRLGLQQAWNKVSPQHLGGIVDTVRTRVLDLALALEKIAPNVGERGAPVPPSEPVRQIINNIYGGANNLAIQSAHVTQSASNVHKGDESSLLSEVAKAGAEGEEVENLRKALELDRANAGGKDPDEPGPEVRGWLGRMMLGTASASGKVATSATGGVIAGLVKAYFGF
jgi:hypothetical protein